MAQKVQVMLVDDLDGGEATETVSFSLDGVAYEIDLTEDNAAELREAFARYVGAARRVGGRSGGRGRRAASSNGSAPRASRGGGGGGSSTSGSGSGSSADIRQWARENGYEVPSRGRISGEIREAYEQAHG